MVIHGNVGQPYPSVLVCKTVNRVQMMAYFLHSPMPSSQPMHVYYSKSLADSKCCLPRRNGAHEEIEIRF